MPRRTRGTRTIVLSDGEVKALSFKPGSNHLAVAGESVSILDIESGKTVAMAHGTNNQKLGRPLNLAGLGFSADWRRMVTVTNFKGAECEIAVQETGGAQGLVLKSRLGNWALSPDGRWLSTLAELWDLDSRKQVYKEEGFVNPLVSVFSPDSSRSARLRDIWLQGQ